MDNQKSPTAPTIPPIPSVDDGGAPPPMPPASTDPTPPSPAPDGSAAPPPDIPPVISSTPKKKFGGGKVIATILGLLLLVGGIGAGVVLVQQKQLFQQKAASNCSSECTTRLSGSSCPGGYTCDGGEVPGSGGNVYYCCKEKSTTTVTTYKCVGDECIPVTDGSGPYQSGATCQAACSSGGGGGGGETTCAGEGACLNGRECCNDLVQQYDSSCASGSANLPYKCVKGGEATCAGEGACVNGRECCTGLTQQYDSSCASGSANLPYKCVSGAACTPAAGCSTAGCSGNSCSIGGATLSDTCFVNHYWCLTRSPGGCSTNKIYSGVSKSSFEKDCGTEQIDIYCEPCCMTTVKAGTYVSNTYDQDCGEGGEESAQCLSVKAYDTEWSPLNVAQLSALAPGTVVRFTVSGTSTSGVIDKARFSIIAKIGEINDGTASGEITAKKPGTEEFYYEYTIPAGATSITVEGEVHHSTLGWF